LSQRLCLQLTVATVIVALVACGGPSAALGDGDPASDVLVTTPLYLPTDASTFGQAGLTGLLGATAKTGFPIRVAMIPSAADLGTVTELWHQPQLYAKYLDMELSVDYQGQVLVVMPDGFGLYGGRIGSAERAALSALPVPGAHARSATTVVGAVEALARAAGHPVRGSFRLAAPTAGAGVSDVGLEWGVFAGGALLIALAWGFSLAARPLGQPPRA
jgi:hypothetical protein